MNTRGVMLVLSPLMLLDPSRSDASPDPYSPLPPWEYEEHAVRPGVRDYSLDARSLGLHGPDRVWADDVHRTRDDPMTGIMFGYRSTMPNPALELDLWIYENDANNSLLPGAIVWRDTFDNLVTSPREGVVIDVRRFFEFDTLVLAPRDLWIAFRFRNQSPHEAGALVVPPGTDQTLGWSSCEFLIDSTGDGVPETPYCHSFEYPGFVIEVYSQPLTPAPGAVTVLATAILVGRRRRR